MSRITPITTRKFIKFLEHIGCKFVRQSGDHMVYRKPGLKRPVIVQDQTEVPVFIILNNLRTLGVTRNEYFEIINEL